MIGAKLALLVVLGSIASLTNGDLVKRSANLPDVLNVKTTNVSVKPQNFKRIYLDCGRMLTLNLLLSSTLKMACMIYNEDSSTSPIYGKDN